MSYTVLARRYRSGTFDEVIGQDHVAQTLKKAIRSGRIAHAYLFCGTRGVGKTSMARILAKALNCESAKGPTDTPCGKCNSCQAIARGEDIDVLEIDAASNTGVDNVRDMIGNAQYRPARSRFKIYIIDEAHMLSKAAFNALLKTLEEPPGHVKFILATTEAEKLLPTILSRCQRYDFRNIGTREIAGHLREICKQEKIKADDDALLLVAKAGAGSMRDSLSLLDRLLSVGETHVTVELVEQLLGLPKTQLVFDLAAAIGAGDVKAALARADSMIQAGLSVDGLLSALVDHLRNLLIVRTCGIESELAEVPGLAPADLQAQAEQFDATALSQDITILEELRRTARQSQAGRALLDATLVRMAMADQFASVADLLARLDGGSVPGGRAPASGRAATSRTVPAAAPSAQKKNSELVNPRVSTPATRPAEPSSPLAIAPPPDLSPIHPPAVDDEDDDLPRPGKVWSGSSLAELHKSQSGVPKPALIAPPAPVENTNPSNVEPVDPRNLPAVWKAMLAHLSAQGQALHGILSHGKLVSINEGQALIRYGPQHETFVKMLERNGKKEVVRDTITRVLNQNVGVRFEVDAVALAAPETVHAEANGTEQSRPTAPEPIAAAAMPARVTAEMVESLRESEPLIRAFMDGLGATIIKVE